MIVNILLLLDRYPYIFGANKIQAAQATNKIPYKRLIQPFDHVSSWSDRMTTRALSHKRLIAP